MYITVVLENILLRLISSLSGNGRGQMRPGDVGLGQQRVWSLTHWRGFMLSITSWVITRWTGLSPIWVHQWQSLKACTLKGSEFESWPTRYNIYLIYINIIPQHVQRSYFIQVPESVTFRQPELKSKQMLHCFHGFILEENFSIPSETHEAPHSRL